MIDRYLKYFCLILCIYSLFSCDKKTPVDYVNPYIGNISHLLVPTYPTVHLPNAMLRVYPERADYTSDILNGLPVAVTSHRGTSAFNLSPVSGQPAASVVQYSYDLEKITPYSYSVYLDEADIQVKFAPSSQSGLYDLEFGKNDNYIVLNTQSGKLDVSSNTISGYQVIDNSNTKIFIYMESSEVPFKVGTVDGSICSCDNTGGDAVFMYYGDKRKVDLRYGISFISTDQAKRNLYREIAHYDVGAVAGQGRKIWNDELGKIEVRGGRVEDRVVFYTSLYRTYERMVNVSEDGKYYSPFDNKIHDDEGTPFYTDDWIWDTYRATHPLRILIDAPKEADMINSYLRMAYQSEQGWMPTFPEITGDSHRMNGNHAVIVLWDAYCKNVGGFDLETAYNACRKTMTEKTLLPWKKEPVCQLDSFYFMKGFYPSLAEGEAETCAVVHPFEKRQAVSVMLGDCYDSWCLAQMADTLGYDSDYEMFYKRSKNYKNIFNERTLFFHPKDKNGNFIQPFDYRFSGGQGAREYYGENNGWIYRWDVPHDIPSLMDMMGGPQKFADNIDRMFRENLGMSKFEFYRQMPDHTGNVGQFSMANEPCLHIPYLYNYAGKPWLAQKRIRTLLDQWFRSDLMGVPGDEDGGGMSAFVVFSMMGFYPVTPGLPEYNIGSPVFRKVKIKLSNNRILEIKAGNYSIGNKYIRSAKLNGKELNIPFLKHNDLMAGGILEFEMTDKPDHSWGVTNLN